MTMYVALKMQIRNRPDLDKIYFRHFGDYESIRYCFKDQGGINYEDK